jgi:putative copper export protein
MLLPFFTWMGESAMGITIRDSVWIYALDQCAHLVALAVFAGAVLIVDLRLMGGGFKDWPIAQVARDAQPWLVWALVVLVVTGIPQLMSNSIKEYYSPWFWEKMGILLVAFIFTFTIRRKVAFTDESRVRPILAKLVGFVSIALWTGVAVLARLIGLLS